MLMKKRQLSAKFVVLFFIDNQFCSFKTRLSVFKSNLKRSFPWQHRAFSVKTSPNPRGPEKREV
jgi:hypothetical protein